VTGGKGAMVNAEISMWEEATVAVDEKLLENVEFDEPLSQQI
jgi:hypothetical protein